MDGLVEMDSQHNGQKNLLKEEKMFVELPEPECIVCRKKNSEIFHRASISGRRCLECGHEQITEDRRATGNQELEPWASSHMRF